MAAADKLTLETFGVDLDALARRITARQTELARDDSACAQLAGVTVSRWVDWKAGHEVPGVGRVPRLAAALDSAPAWILFGATPNGDAIAESRASTTDTRRTLDILTRLAPAVEIVETLAEEIARLNIPIPGGAVMGVSLGVAGELLRAADAVTVSTSRL